MADFKQAFFGGRVFFVCQKFPFFHFAQFYKVFNIAFRQW